MLSSPELVDTNIEHMVKIAILHIISLGTKHGIFSLLAKGPTLQELIEGVNLPNRALLVKFVSTLKDLHIVEVKNGRLHLNGFSYILEVPPVKYNLLLPDWVSIQEEIYRMVDYAFITPTHPQILMDFDKDADFWDMRMSTSFSQAYRKVMVDVAGIKPGFSVLDIGCGSVSPEFFGKIVGYDGLYMGVDYSPALLEIARLRVEEKNLPVSLKEIDARLIRPVNEYDAVLMSFVLEYMPDREKVLKNAFETLKPGGKLIIVEPFRDSFENISALEFFESLNKDFTGFPSISEIISIFENMDIEFKTKQFGKSILLLEKL
ncbi:methyltransferase domain-containing protein [Thermococcus sp.]|uniref:class I SAM-dependent methyltransferase n=1 Tax=Thermococcus sp. TaxID=35749 RepID=UPI00262A457E|nr:methyltransferase domain-containing protein [Thermococcus sp.]